MAQTTVSVSILPPAVVTATTLPSRVSTPVAAQWAMSRAPCRRAAEAYPRTTDSGVQCPSVGLYVAATSPSVVMSGDRRLASATESIRLGTPSSFCSATFRSNACTWSGESSRNR